MHSTPYLFLSAQSQGMLFRWFNYIWWKSHRFPKRYIFVCFFPHPPSHRCKRCSEKLFVTPQVICHEIPCNSLLESSASEAVNLEEFFAQIYTLIHDCSFTSLPMITLLRECDSPYIKVFFLLLSRFAILLNKMSHTLRSWSTEKSFWLCLIWFVERYETKSNASECFTWEANIRSRFVCLGTSQWRNTILACVQPHYKVSLEKNIKASDGLKLLDGLFPRPLGVELTALFFYNTILKIGITQWKNSRSCSYNIFQH